MSEAKSPCCSAAMTFESMGSVIRARCLKCGTLVPGSWPATGGSKGSGSKPEKKSRSVAEMLLGIILHGPGCHCEQCRVWIVSKPSGERHA